MSISKILNFSGNCQVSKLALARLLRCLSPRDVLTARANREHFLCLMKQRQEEGLNIAKKCAYLLKTKYGVAKFVLFGSLLNHEKMTPHSDIDLAVSNLSKKDYFRAMADLDSGHTFEIDLVEIQKAHPYILDAIHQGIEL